MKELSKHGMIHTDCLTVTGKTVGENLADVPDIPTGGQDVIFPVSNPWAEHGNHISILRGTYSGEYTVLCHTAIYPCCLVHLCVCTPGAGSLAPDGAVIKLSGKDIRTFSGPAKVFNSERETFYGITNNEVSAGDCVICRYEGPKGAPGKQPSPNPHANLTHSSPNPHKPRLILI